MSSKVWLLIFTLACVALPSIGQVKAVEKPDSPQQDFSKEAYIIEHLASRIKAERDGTGTREVTAEVKVLADAGVKAFAVLNFVYTSTNEVVDVDYVRVRKPDGALVKTPDYNIQDMPGEVTRTAPLYSDIHEKHIAVKGLAVGDVLEYLVRFRTVKPEVPGHFWYQYSFTDKEIIQDERLEVSLPQDKYVKVVSPAFKPEIKDEGERRVYRWTHSNLIVREIDPDEVPRRTLPNPDVQITTFANWEDVGHWYGELQKGPLQVTPAIQSKATELTKGLKTDDEKIHAIYNFVSLKFHYIGLDFGIGRYQPHAADDVLDNGYGDCKDKHTLLASLLKGAGYNAWPALIHASRKLDPEVPSPAQFNHVITVVPLDASYIWLDSTPEVAPYRLLLQPLRNKQALVIPTDQPPRLMTTPEYPPFPQNQEFSMSGKLTSDGTFTAHAEQRYEGDAEIALRIAFRQVPQSQWKELVQRFSRALNFGGDVSNVQVSAPDDLDKPFKISYDYMRKDFGDWENHHTTAALPPLGIEAFKGVKDKKPPEPVLLGAPGKITYRSRLELPPGYNVNPPFPVHLETSYAKYDGTSRVEDGVMTTTRVLAIKKSEVPLSEWEAFRQFGETIASDEFDPMTVEHIGNAASEKTMSVKNDADKSKAAKDEKLDSADLARIFSDGTAALQNRDITRAKDLFEKVIALDSNYRGAHFNLGVLMMAQNHPTEALAAFRKEEEISPDDPRSFQAAAEVANVMGKKDVAIEEVRKLIQADPGNRRAPMMLGELLYQTGKYSEAVGVLETAEKAAPQNTNLQLQLAGAYLKTGQKDKALASFRGVVEQKSDDSATLNDVAYTMAENNLDLDLARQYAEKAILKLEQRSQGAESSDDAELRVTYEFSLVWDTLGWIYFRQGDLKRAESWIRPAWLLGEDSVVAEHLGEIYEKQGKTQQAARHYTFALALAANPYSFSGLPGPDAMKAYQTRTDEITARYQKLTGKKPELHATWRLPNGEWTQTPMEQLQHARELKLSNESKLSGSAEFLVEFRVGKVDSAHYASGSATLQPLAEKLKTAHYPFEFPPDSEAIVMMRVTVRCEPTAACIAKLDKPQPPAPQQTAAVR